MKGHVDHALRALLEISTRSESAGPTRWVAMWVDTACNGYLFFSQHLIDDLNLEQEAATDAVLADGSRVTLESHICYVDWFGNLVPAQVIANDGSFPLLGTAMLVVFVIRGLDDPDPERPRIVHRKLLFVIQPPMSGAAPLDLKGIAIADQIVGHCLIELGTKRNRCTPLIPPALSHRPGPPPHPTLPEPHYLKTTTWKRNTTTLPFFFPSSGAF